MRIKQVTELSFLIDLLLNHKLDKKTKDAIANRIKEVEELFSIDRVVIPSAVKVPSYTPLPPALANQAPSTIAAMIKHGEIPPMAIPDAIKPEAVAVVAHTPQATAAMQARQQSIMQAMSGKPMPGESKPRKF